MELPHHQIGRIVFVYNGFLFLVDVFGADKDAKRMDGKVPIISIITIYSEYINKATNELLILTK